MSRGRKRAREGGREGGCCKYTHKQKAGLHRGEENKECQTEAQIGLKQPVVGTFTRKQGKSDVAANRDTRSLGITLIKAWDPKKAPICKGKMAI